MGTSRLNRIFVVDDSRECISILDAILTQAGYSVCPVFDATDLFGRIFEERPALALVDVKMPGVDGATLTRLLKHAGLKLPVLLCSCLPEAELAQLTLRCGADGYVSKSYPPERILRTIRRVLVQAEQLKCTA